MKVLFPFEKKNEQDTFLVKMTSNVLLRDTVLG